MELESLIVGMGGAVIALAGGIKLKGFTLLEKEKAEVYAELKEAVGNIDLVEITGILVTAQVYASEGYTDKELIALGKKLVDAAKSGETCLAAKGN